MMLILNYDLALDLPSFKTNTHSFYLASFSRYLA